MGKRHPNLPAWQWRQYPQNHQHPTNLALQRHGHSLEAQASEPFSDRKDAVQRLVVEQFVTFPRFVLSGGWWRAWRQRHHH